MILDELSYLFQILKQRFGLTEHFNVISVQLIKSVQLY